MKAVLGPTNVGWYACIICFPLSWYYLEQAVVIQLPYREGLTALLSAGNFLPLMVAAVASAWEGGRQSGATLGVSTSVRSPFIIASLSILPVFVTVACSHLVATAIVLGSNGVTPPLPDLSLYCGFLGLLFGVSISSWFLGYFISNIIAAPLTAITVYFLAISGSLTGHPEYRAFIADRSGCCGIDQQVDWRSIASPLLLAFGLVLVSCAVASWLWIRSGLYPLVGFGGAAALILGLVLPGFMSDPWATEARSSAELTCETSPTTGIEYCVWPEQKRQSAALHSQGDESLTIWYSQSLIAEPHRVSLGGDSQEREGHFVIDLPPNASNGNIALALALGVLPDPSRCQGSAPEGFSFYALVIWLAVDAGTAIDDPTFDQFQGMGRTSLRDEVASKRAMPLTEQLAWFTSNSELLATCQTRSTT